MDIRRFHPYKCWNTISKQSFLVLQPSCFKSEARIKSSGSFPPWLHVAVMRKHHIWVSWQNSLIECEHGWRLATPSRFVSHRRAYKAAGRLPGSPSTGEPEPTAAPLRPPDGVQTASVLTPVGEACFDEICGFYQPWTFLWALPGKERTSCCDDVRETMVRSQFYSSPLI